MNQRDSRRYRGVKWAWLLLQCAMPVLAALYFTQHLKTTGAGAALPPALAEPLLGLSGALYLVLWIVAESMLSMYRFPLELSDAWPLVGGFTGQFAVLALTGGSVPFAAYAGLYVTLAALLACGFLMLVAGRRMRDGGRLGGRIRLAPLAIGVPAALLVAVLPLVALWPALRTGLGNLGPARLAVSLCVLAANVVITVRTLIGFSILGQPDPRAAEYDVEWERWAPQTVILLILAATAAAITVGLDRAMG